MLLNEEREKYYGDVVDDANTYYNQNIDNINEEAIPDVTAFKDKETGHYVVAIGESVFEMDEYATAPNGVNTFLGTKSELTKDLGEPVDVENLPESVKDAIIERMKEDSNKNENETVRASGKYMPEEIFYAPKKEKKVVKESKEPKAPESDVVIQGSKWL